MRKSKLLFMALCMLLGQGAVLAGEGAARAQTPVQVQEQKQVQASLVAEKDSVSAERPFMVAVKFDIAKGWHTYYKNPGETGEATKIKLSLPSGFVAGEILWQEPKVFDTVGFTEYGYSDEVYHFVKITPPEGFSGDEVKMVARVHWLSCGFGECVPGEARLELTVPVEENGAPVAGFTEALQKVEVADGGSGSGGDFSSQGESEELLFILLLAFGGGLLLNLMPCVFPIISLKIFGLMKTSAKTVRKNALFYTVGVVGAFMAVAAILVAVKSAGGLLGWGFQLQNPAFVLFMISLLLVLGMMFSGFITAPSFIKGSGAGAGKNGALMSGVLAVLLATPCVAPFMGTAVAYGLLASWQEAIFVFFFMGLGMAFPILVLAIFRGWVRFMPKSGRWMKVVEEVLAIPLYLSAVWLLWVLERQTGAVGFSIAIIVQIFIIMAAFLRKKAMWYFAAAALVLALFAIKEDAQKFGDDFWQAYSEKALKENLASGKAVFLKFSADWCLTCLVNEKLVLDSASIRELLIKYGAVPMEADWTARDEGILKALNSYGKNGVPLYVFYKKGQSIPIILPRIITKTDVEKAVKDG